MSKKVKAVLLTDIQALLSRMATQFYYGTNGVTDPLKVNLHEEKQKARADLCIVLADAFNIYTFEMVQPTVDKKELANEVQ